MSTHHVRTKFEDVPDDLVAVNIAGARKWAHGIFAATDNDATRKAALVVLEAAEVCRRNDTQLTRKFVSEWGNYRGHTPKTLSTGLGNLAEMDSIEFDGAEVVVKL